MISIPVVAGDPFGALPLKIDLRPGDLGNPHRSHRIAIWDIHIEDEDLIRTHQFRIHNMGCNL